jgi:hypothetical protein
MPQTEVADLTAKCRTKKLGQKQVSTEKQPRKRDSKAKDKIQNKELAEVQGKRSQLVLNQSGELVKIRLYIPARRSGPKKG